MRLKKEDCEGEEKEKGVFDFAKWIFLFFFLNSQFGDFYVFEVVFIGGGLGFGEL